jgi:ribosome biogenesis ATPase
MAVGIHVRETYGHAFFFHSATELIAGVTGESEQNIRNLFDEAATNAPSLLFIDELDSIAGRKASASKDMERRVVSQLLSSLDALPPSVFLLAATSRPEALDTGLRRSGRFDREICLGVPDEKGRKEMLDAMSHRVKKKEDFSFEKIAKLTPGYVPADLQSLIREAGLIAVDRISKEKEEKKEVREVLMEDDVEQALTFVQPTAKREGFSVVPDVTWEDIGALKDLKQELENSLILPIRKADLFKKFNISLPAGVLLYGPPGCGKTLLAKAVANASKANFIAIKGPELLNKYVGESEKAVRSVFSRARNSAPCIIFFDEIDSLCPRRSNDSSNPSSERVVNQFLTELDGVDNRKDVFIIAATNRPDIIDPAMLRPGRLDKTLYVPLPNDNDRISIIKALTRKSPIGKDVDLDEMSKDKRLEGFSGADLGALVKEAGVGAILREGEAIEAQDFERAMGKVIKSLGEKDRKEFERFRGSLKGVF